MNPFKRKKNCFTIYLNMVHIETWMISMKTKIGIKDEFLSNIQREVERVCVYSCSKASADIFLRILCAF